MTTSSMKSIIAGASQSSALSPLVCLLFTNDSPNSSLMRTILFACDAGLVQSDNNLDNLQNLVNRKVTKVID